MASPKPGSWYSLEQIYIYFGIRESKIRYAIKVGNLKVQQVTMSRGDGYKYLVEGSSLNNWLANPPKRGRKKAVPGPIVTTHYIREEEPLVIKEFTPVSDILKEGQTMSVGEIMEKVDNAIVEEAKPTYSEENFGDGTWVNLVEASTLVETNKGTIRSAIYTGKLPAKKMSCDVPGGRGFKWMLKLEDLEAWNGGRPSSQKPAVSEERNDDEDSSVKKQTYSEESFGGRWVTVEEMVRSIFDKAEAAARKEGYDEGYDEGYAAGFEAAWHEVEGKVLKALERKIEE